MNLYFIRHARQTDTTEPEDYDVDGSEKQPLSDEGLKQAEKLACRLLREDLKFDVILSSSLKRARKTAEIVANTLSLPVTLEARLRECRIVLPPYSPSEVAAEVWARARREISKPTFPVVPSPTGNPLRRTE